MSQLAEALNIIMHWLEQNQPEFAASFLPGLTNEQIEEITKHFPFQLPGEYYELYRWRNGTRERQNILFYPSMAFLPLEDVINFDQDTFNSGEGTDEYITLRFEGNRLFPFLDDEGDVCAVVVSEEKQESSPVIYVLAEYYEPKILYSSLTSMMQAIAECYETGAYYLIEDRFVEQDEKKAAAILHKYNRDVLESDNY